MIVIIFCKTFTIEIKKRARVLCSVIEPCMNSKFTKEVLREKWAADKVFSHFLSELKTHKWFYNWTEQAGLVF